MVQQLVFGTATLACRSALCQTMRGGPTMPPLGLTDRIRAAVHVNISSGHAQLIARGRINLGRAKAFVQFPQTELSFDLSAMCFKEVFGTAMIRSAMPPFRRGSCSLAAITPQRSGPVLKTQAVRFGFLGSMTTRQYAPSEKLPRGVTAVMNLPRAGGAVLNNGQDRKAFR